MVPAHGAVEVSGLEISRLPVLPLERYQELATQGLVQALVRSGLYVDEALAMVNTWRHSYFLNPGTRILYVLPTAWTDRILPLRMSPQPAELVRTLVGRVETMGQAEEARLLAAVRELQASKRDPRKFLASLGRFAESKLKRLEAILAQSGTSKELRSFVLGLIQVAQSRS